MLAVGIKDLKNRLTYFLKLVETGEHIVITRRDEPVAELRRLGDAADSSGDAHLMALVRKGVVRLPSVENLAPFDPLSLEGPSVAEAILEDRR